MARFSAAVSLFLALAAIPALSQTTAKLQVRLSYSDGSQFRTAEGTPGIDSTARDAGTANQVRGAAAAMQIRVQLQDGYGSVVSERSPGNDGRLEFVIQIQSAARSNAAVQTPTYRVRVIGPEIEEAVVDGVDPFHGEHMVDVVLRRKSDSPDKARGGPANPAMVSLARLQVPDSARKELDKGDTALQQRDMAGAEAHFRKAIALFPGYDQAYNNLGVVLIGTGRTEEARQAFEKAVSLNDKFARAYTNLGRIALMNKKYADADAFLHKSLQADPRNAEALMLAAQAALFTDHFEDAVNDAHAMHLLPHAGFGFGHFIAARALEALSRPAEAAVEYRLFLQEAPDSPNVPGARAALAKLPQTPEP